MTSYVYPLSITSSATIDVDHDTYLVDASSGSIVLTFPSASQDGDQYIVRRTDSSVNTVTLATTDSHTIDVLPQSTRTITSYGGNWITVDGPSYIDYSYGPTGTTGWDASSGPTGIAGSLGPTGIKGTTGPLGGHLIEMSSGGVMTSGRFLTNGLNRTGEIQTQIYVIRASTLSMLSATSIQTAIGGAGNTWTYTVRTASSAGTGTDTALSVSTALLGSVSAVSADNFSTVVSIPAGTYVSLRVVYSSAIPPPSTTVMASFVIT